jgi:hypothetical protein
MFIPRHPVVENQFCSYASQTGTGAAGIGGVIAYAGSVVYLDPAATNEEPVVKKMAAGVTEAPFGLLMQKVKTGYHQVHPAGFYMPGDLGSSDAIAQPLYNASGSITGTKSVPAGVAHLGIWDTVHYTCTGAEAGTITAKMAPGMSLYPAVDEAKLTNNTVGGGTGTDAENPIGQVVVARVVKGASIAKCTATINNTTLYPIRVKLLV